MRPSQASALRRSSASRGHDNCRSQFQSPQRSLNALLIPAYVLEGPINFVGEVDQKLARIEVDFCAEMFASIVRHGHPDRKACVQRTGPGQAFHARRSRTERFARTPRSPVRQCPCEIDQDEWCWRTEAPWHGRRSARCPRGSRTRPACGESFVGVGVITSFASNTLWSWL